MKCEECTDGKHRRCLGGGCECVCDGYVSRHTCHLMNPPHPYPCLACEREKTQWAASSDGHKAQG